MSGLDPKDGLPAMRFTVAGIKMQFRLQMSVSGTWTTNTVNIWGEDFKDCLKQAEKYMNDLENFHIGQGKNVQNKMMDILSS